MRLPTEAQLSLEQREVCYAPIDGTMLVSGPPGSGKTIVALFRAKMLESNGDRVQAVMYNKVLARYVGDHHPFLTWIARWWFETVARRFPLGPTRKRYDLDFDRARELLEDKAVRDKVRRRGHWGHLILDEAQDFAPAAHRLLWCVQNAVFSDVPAEERPTLLILADENQRITESNSTIAQIREAHMLTRDEVYQLRKNYRNTREIAAFAANFYADLPSGVPDLPKRRGDLPKVHVTADIRDAAQRIARHVRLHDDHEVGVLVQYDRLRGQFFDALKRVTRGTRIQTYSSKDEAHQNPEDLTFGTPGITVLSFNSAKGLEFDAVFLPELQKLRLDPLNTDAVKMTLYVMTSRARTTLNLLITDPNRAAGFWNLLPPNGDSYHLE